MKKLLLAIVVLFPACSGADDSEPSCDLAHRQGTYLQHATERAGGTCGALTDTVARVDALAPLPDGCTRTAEDSVSADQCKLERAFDCTPNADGIAASAVGFTIEHDGGNRITGTLTITMRNASGQTQCLSTYDLESTRQ